MSCFPQSTAKFSRKIGTGPQSPQSYTQGHAELIGAISNQLCVALRITLRILRACADFSGNFAVLCGKQDSTNFASAMKERFLKYIADNRLFAEGEKTLIAASAGVDSTVLCHLFRQCGLPFAIAHCNFKLRGEASDGDEIFIKKLAEGFGVPFHLAHFDTEKYAAENKQSIQLAARNLRYRFFEKTRQAAGYQYIATAHHLDDSIETMLFNFAKGCGIRGLRGILPKNGRIVRPLLFATKKEISAFAKKEGIAFREDASNLADKYSRNKIRQHIIPVFEKINPAFQSNAGGTLERLKEVEALYFHAVNSIKEGILSVESDIAEQLGNFKIDNKKLLASPAPSSVLYEILSPFGFNNSQVRQMLKSIGTQPGSVFSSASHRLLVDRSFLILQKKEKAGGVKQIHPNDRKAETENGILILKKTGKKAAAFSPDPNTAQLDFDKLEWPLILRHWREGDIFQPLGMGGRHKKLQDYFTDEKMSRFQKEKTLVLESGGKICWIVGKRIDERFKIAESTRHCLVVEFLPTTFAKKKND
ncbi:MAG TPA: tRNA lysidine(34) synthetase TilS [Bacteroidetes bacterium]|nr:tRNA lysidine(34) synthetase TilS [Bacteroidota bacterium]